MAQRGRTPTNFLMFVSYCCVYNSANGWGDFLDTLGGVVPLGVANLLGRWGDFVRPVYGFQMETDIRCCQGCLEIPQSVTSSKVSCSPGARLGLSQSPIQKEIIWERSFKLSSDVCWIMSCGIGSGT